MKECISDGCSKPARNPSMNKTTGKWSYPAKCNTCNNMISKFGITTPQRDQMLEEQDYSCMICDSPIEFIGVRGASKHSAAVDHCHTHGHVRGILCAACNLGLGHFFDSPELLRNAANYLEESQ